MELVDSYGRTINYLRLSVTDRCNFRCRYCMPAEGVSLRHHDEILSYEEFLVIARAAISMGVEKIRITGGEPLLRRGIVDFIRSLATLPGLRHLALTTNAFLLEEMADDLKSAGLHRLNISLDSLDPQTFAHITRGGDLERVMAGIAAASLAGFPIKLNMVPMRGVNDHEIIRFATLTLDHPYAVRFIEYMPAAKSDDWKSLLVPGGEILDRIASHFRLVPRDKGRYSGPSRDFAIEGGRGTIGIITPISGHFCSECNRIRVTSAGKVKSCLFSDAAVDLKPALAEGVEGVRRILEGVVCAKPKGHGMNETRQEGFTPFAMSGVGG
ncbi:MAG: GTP 3',8-cyclase MoaA [Desulfuromonadia bacterium]